MVILADQSDERCSTFVQEHILAYTIHIQVSHYMQLRLDTGNLGNGAVKTFAAEQQWPIPAAGSVTAVTLDGSGKELGRTTFDVAADDAKDNATAFVDAHLPPVVDAQKKWDEAFELASKTNRRVWVRISQRYCGPCHLLNR